MKIIALSDTHLEFKMKDAPSGDLLILAGDVLSVGRMKELISFMAELEAEADRWKHILLVPGNHDFALEKFANSGVSWEQFAKDYEIDSYPENMTISHEGLVEILGLKIFTWSWIPNLVRWAFYKMDHDVKEYCEKFDMPDRVDIFVSHGPPRGVLDYVPRTGQVGSRSMLEVFNFEHNIHIFGHIHESYGRMLRDKSIKIKTADAEYRRFYNVAVLNGYYLIENEPITLDI